MPFGFSMIVTMSRTPPIVMSQVPRSIQSRKIVPRPPAAKRAAEHRAEHPADAADHGVADQVDRFERLEAAVDDGRVLEREEDAGERGDGSTDRERVELRAEHADPERRRGAFVVPHRDEAQPGPGTTQVRDHEAGEDEDPEADDEVALRVRRRVHVPAEHVDPADLGHRAEVPGEVLVAEDHLLDGEAHARA